MEEKTSQQTDHLQHHSRIYDFGDCIFNAHHGEIYSKVSSDCLHIEKKVTEVFECLARSKGEIVTRDEIFDQVWPNQIVSDDSLNRCISVLRKTLKDFNHQVSIKTHPKIGFHIEVPNFCPLKNTPYCSAMSGQQDNHKTTSLDNNKSAESRLTKPNVLAGLVLLILIFSVFTMILFKQQAFTTPALNQHRIVIMPFISGDTSTQTNSLLEDKFRRLLTNHPLHMSISKGELSNVKQSSVREIGQYFNARFIIKAKTNTSKNRELLTWQIIDAQTGDELFNEQINLALHSDQENALAMVGEFIFTHAHLTLKSQINKQVQYIVKSAQYLISEQKNLSGQLPIINLLARTLTDKDPNSVAVLKLLAQQLTISHSPVTQKNIAYQNLAIKMLEKSVMIAPKQEDLYLLLTKLYLNTYQWQKVRQLLAATNQKRAQQHLNPLSFNLLDAYTGQNFSSRFKQAQRDHLVSPLDAELAKKLLMLYLEIDETVPALAIANTLSWDQQKINQLGAILGPVYLRAGEIEQGKRLTIQGYQALGVAPSYADVVVQAILYPNYQLQASDFITRAAANNLLPKSLLPMIYAEIADINNFYKSALKLSSTFQFDVTTMMRSNSKLIRQHQNFTTLMEKLGLIDYWKKFGQPYFCFPPNNISCESLTRLTSIQTN